MQQVKSKPSELQQDTDATTSIASSTPNQLSNEIQSSIVESAATSNETTSTDKPTTSSPSSQKGKSSKKSAQDSTTKEKTFFPFWNESCQEISNKLWSHIKTDSPDSGLSLSVGCVNKIIQNSWFSTERTCLQKENSLKISLPLSTSLAANSTDSESTKIKSKKTRVYPETKLKSEWKKWVNASRFCYNKAIAYLKDCFINQTKLPSGYDLRKIVLSDLPEWVASTPYNPRGAAVLDAHAAFKKTKNKAEPKFRAWFEQVKSIKLQASNWGHGTAYSNQKIDGISIKKLGLKINPSEELPVKMPSDFSIVLDRGRWYICYSVPLEITPSNTDRAISLDPGVRTFMTGFDGSDILEFGKNSISQIVILCNRLDKIQSQITLNSGGLNKRLRFKLRKLSEKIRIRIRNLIDDAHSKIAAYLTKNYKDIFLPTFETSKMVVKKRRKIRSKTARSMLTWSHYRFKQTLKFHALKRGVNVHDVTEEYTSKTCSKCGHVHSKLGGNKHFKCPNCGHRIDRDWNGAINILIKSLNALLSGGAGLDNTRYMVETSTSY